MRLNDEEKRMLSGQEGEAKKLAMEILTQVGDSMDADSCRFVKHMLHHKAGNHIKCL